MVLTLQIQYRGWLHDTRQAGSLQG